MGDMDKLTVRVPKKLLALLKLTAAEDRRTVQATLIRALEVYLRKRGAA